MYINTEDEIVETRTWSSGTEIVARVNWSQIARVRRVLGLAGEEFRQGQFVQLQCHVQRKKTGRRTG
jgi:hypothetical protein